MIHEDHTFRRLQGRQVNEGRVREIVRASVDIMISLPTSIGEGRSVGQEIVKVAGRRD